MFLLTASPHKQCTCEARIEETQDSTKVNSRVVVWTPVRLKGLLGHASKNVWASKLCHKNSAWFDVSIFKLYANKKNVIMNCISIHRKQIPLSFRQRLPAESGNVFTARNIGSHGSCSEAQGDLIPV